MEAEAIIVILNRCMADWDLVGSEVIEYEIGQMADEERKNAVQHFLACNRKMVKITENIVKRARIFHEMGIDTFDALHLASAESVNAIFLTTDDSLIKIINRQEDTILISVHNPVQWLLEVTNGNENTQ